MMVAAFILLGTGLDLKKIGDGFFYSDKLPLQLAFSSLYFLESVELVLCVLNLIKDADL